MKKKKRKLNIGKGGRVTRKGKTKRNIGKTIRRMIKLTNEEMKNVSLNEKKRWKQRMQ